MSESGRPSLTRGKSHFRQVRVLLDRYVATTNLGTSYSGPDGTQN